MEELTTITPQQITEELIGDENLWREILVYDHLKKRNNHFLFYLKLNEFYVKVKTHGDHSKLFMEWVSSVKHTIDEQRKLYIAEYSFIYDIIVAPTNITNASFVEDINIGVFGGAPVVIFLDTDKEYRDNIKTKYSNLTILYENIVKTNEKFVINFHFVNDTIASGGSFYRAKSLISSLFDGKNEKVKINIFQNVILLTNRSSINTRLNYVENAMNFHTFFQFDIPSMRNHQEGSCFMCELGRQCNRLISESGTNQMASYWAEKQEYYSFKDIEKGETKKSYSHPDREYKRFYCTQILHKVFSDSGFDVNSSAKIQDMFFERILTKIEDENLCNNEKMEYLISYIKVFTRPFLCYRKSNYEVGFNILLLLLEYMVSTGTEQEELIKRIKQKEYIITSDMFIEILLFLSNIQDTTSEYREVLSALFLTLMSRLASMGSTYLIRKPNFKRLKKFADDSGIQNFDFRYASMIKKFLNMSKDETINLWLEYLLVTGYEYGNDSFEEMHLAQYDNNNNLELLLYLENTHIIYDAINELYIKDSSIKKINIDELILEYYFENYRKLIYFSYHSILGTNGVRKEDAQAGETMKNAIYGLEDPYDSLTRETAIMEEIKYMLSFYKHLQESDGDLEAYYNKLAGLVKNISLSKSVIMFGYDEKSRMSYEIAKSGFDDYLGFDANVLFKNVTSQIGDTVFIIEDQNSIFIKMKKATNDMNGQDSIFFYISYEKKASNILSRLYSIRNILAFRNSLQEKIDIDFSNNVFQKLKAEREKNQILRNIKVYSHSPDALLIEALNLITRCKNEDTRIATVLAQFAADSLISKISYEFAADTPNIPLSSEHITYGKKLILADYLNILNSITHLNKNQDISNPTKVQIVNNCPAQINYECIVEHEHYIVFFIILLIQNAARHGKARNNVVEITIEYNYHTKMIEFSNILKEGAQEKMRENGITMRTLEQYLQLYYPECELLNEKNGIHYTYLPTIMKQPSE